ncbi:MAG: GxxExxY protein [Muribaculaceae bacterium]|nr:GxxExxY protein [Muribaculaceae bacterium]
MVDKEVLISKIIDCANNVQRILTSGYLEKVYENALAHELSQIGISVSQQQPLEVR